MLRKAVLKISAIQDYQIVIVLITSISFLVVMGGVIVVFFYFSRKKVLKTELEKANLEIIHQKEMIQANLITQEEERRRIAQDLHDAISSKLNIVSLNANFLADPDLHSEQVKKVGQSIVKVTNTVLESARKIAHDLLPPTLEKFGLQAALEELCEEIEETEAYTIHTIIQYEPGFLQPSNELHLFRIVQELLNNSIKHAQAKGLSVLLKTEANQLQLRYSDDGKGVSLQHTKIENGLGMSGIENRAQILNGVLQISSKPGEGFQVTLTITNV